MVKFKSLIKQKFNNASGSYDRVADIQYKVAQKLVDLLQQEATQFVPTSILDLGAGTGYVASTLSDLFPNANYTLNDISENMLKEAHKKMSRKNNVSYLLGDMENSDLELYDLVVSSFAFQWLFNLEKSLKYFFEHCNRIFAFTTLLQGSLQEFRAEIQKYGTNIKLKQYPTESELHDYIKNLGASRMTLCTQKFFLEFANIRGFIKYLKDLGASASDGYHIPPKMLKSILSNDSNCFKTNYDVAFVILIK